jgi:hypothetical protein
MNPEHVSTSCSKSFGRLVLEYAAFLLSTNVHGIYADISTLHTDYYTNENLSVEENAEILVNIIKVNRMRKKA